MTRSALGWLDLFVPKDSGTARIATGVPFGPDPRHRLDIYAPTNPTAKLPVMLFSYGGGWNSGTRADYAFAGRAFAGLGFLTLICDYRLVPQVRYPAFIEDGALAANWAIANAARYGGDPERILLGGHSAGAYNAVMLALDPAGFGTPGLARRLRGLVGLSGPYDFFPFDVSESIDAFGQYPDPERTQPVNLVTTAAPPMLLVHGDRDTIVAPRNAVALARELRRHDVAVTELHYSGLGHAGSLLNLMVPFRWRNGQFAAMAAFLKAAIA